ncbi:hypothetical protein SUGI_0609030 [Cryptomeria japonica]|nr:hypothetical protein SUGI_0609030 [Cryptomeria japonica]
MYLPYDMYSLMSYRYTKTNIAESVSKRENSMRMDDRIRGRLFKYPLKEARQSRDSFHVFARDVSVHSTITSSGFNSNATMNLEIIAMEEFMWMDLSDKPICPNYEETQSVRLKQEQICQEERRLLKVATQLKLHEIFPTVFKLSVEGVYDPQRGKMYLVGCLDIRVRAEIFHSNSSYDAKDGLDCQIELKLQYPPTNFRLLMDPSMKVSIQSSRTESDPLYFKPVEFHTAPILYNRQTAELIPRRTLKTMLNILSLCLATACIIIQLLYVVHNAEAAAYISLVMVGIQYFSNNWYKLLIFCKLRSPF